jgi:UDPglucose 6-dehydrogenase
MNFPFLNNPKIGIVGLGFVGSAIAESMEGMANLVLVDKDPSRGTHTFKDLADCEGVFVCVPTPMSTDGKCDTGILEYVLIQLKDYKGVIISKCTAPPSVYQALNDQYPNLVHAPEFLTAANAVRDYANGKFAIIGGSVGAYQRDAERIIRFGQTALEQVQHCTIQEAALSKYAINSFLSTKVTFMNELYALATKTGQDYNKIANMVAMDSRIGNSHMKVPGPDGEFGFGGMCFPKDTSALLKYAEQQGVQMNVLDAAVKKNLILRLTEPK